MRRIGMRVLRGVGVGAVLGAALAGCSQAAAIAPVGGTHQVEVRYATIDVLQQNSVAILTAPVCATTAGAVRCEGATTSGEKIVSVSTAADPASVTVTVGAASLYSGAVLDVIDRAARSGS